MRSERRIILQDLLFGGSAAGSNTPHRSAEKSDTAGLVFVSPVSASGRNVTDMDVSIEFYNTTIKKISVQYTSRSSRQRFRKIGSYMPFD